MWFPSMCRHCKVQFWFSAIQLFQKVIIMTTEHLFSHTSHFRMFTSCLFLQSCLSCQSFQNAYFLFCWIMSFQNIHFLFVQSFSVISEYSLPFCSVIPNRFRMFTSFFPAIPSHFRIFTSFLFSHSQSFQNIHFLLFNHSQSFQNVHFLFVQSFPVISECSPPFCSTILSFQMFTSFLFSHS